MDNIIPINTPPAARIYEKNSTRSRQAGHAKETGDHQPISPVSAALKTPSVVNPAHTGHDPRDIPLEKIQAAVSKVSAFIQENTKTDRLSFQVEHNKAGPVTMITVMEKETNKVVRQIPSEEMLAMAKAVQSISGLLHVTA